MVTRPSNFQGQLLLYFSTRSADLRVLRKALKVSLEATFRRVCCMGNSRFLAADYGKEGGSAATLGGTQGVEG